MYSLLRSCGGKAPKRQSEFPTPEEVETWRQESVLRIRRRLERACKNAGMQLGPLHPHHNHHVGTRNQIKKVTTGVCQKPKVNTSVSQKSKVNSIVRQKSKVNASVQGFITPAV